MRKTQWLGGCLLVGLACAVSCSSDDSSTTTTRGGTGGAGGGETGGTSASGGTAGTGVTGGSGTTGGSGGASAGGSGGAGAGGSGGATGGSAGSGGASASGGTGGAAGKGGAAGTGGAAGSGGSAGTAVDSGSPMMDAAVDRSTPPPGMCGDASTGTGAAFPPITGYTAKDGGFGPAVTTRNTGDGGLGTDPDGGANKVAIFRPAAAKYGQGGVTHPVIVWGNGSTNTVDIWQSFLARVATYGFVVVAPEQTQVTADHMNAAIDYVLRLASDPTSGDCGKIDTTKIGSTGYSRGGGGAITVASNARITSTFIFASNGTVKNIKSPWAIIGGDADTTFTWATISTAVTGSTQPAFGAALAGIDHNGVASNAKSQEGYIGFMRWRFMGDKAGHDIFVGPSCQFCLDTAFSAFVKTPTFDSL
ncbi:MAG TPA: hypothetical protein VK550_13320 [Polyangiaceae bacterium]|nr:hypothetical protein [Polyangiaceae bacterium]